MADVDPDSQRFSAEHCAHADNPGAIFARVGNADEAVRDPLRETARLKQPERQQCQFQRRSGRAFRRPDSHEHRRIGRFGTRAENVQLEPKLGNAGVKG